MLAGLKDNTENVFVRKEQCLPLSEKVDVDKLREVSKVFIGKHDFREFTARSLLKHTGEYTFLKTITDISVQETSTEMSPVCEGQLQRVRIRFRARGFLQYQVRYMMGAMLQVLRGDKSTEDVQGMLDREGGILQQEDNTRSLAPARGLVLIDTVFKDNHLFEEPIMVPEPYFMKGHKKKLLLKGIEYRVPTEEEEMEIGGLFD